MTTTFPTLPGYTLQRELGAGGMGTTYAATRDCDGTLVAIKTLDLSRVEEWKSMELFEREAEVLQAIDLPGVPDYVDSLTFGESGYAIVQELAPGEPLDRVVKRGPLPVDDGRDILRQVLEILIGLQAMQPPVVHRDVKPANLVREMDGTVRLVDFGAVKAVWDEAVGGGSTVIGTFGYMAPEQFRGSASLATDIYGLGATFLNLVTGRDVADFDVVGLRIQFADVVTLPPALAAWLNKALEPDEALRFSSARAALNALERPAARSTLEPLPESSLVRVTSAHDNATLRVNAPGLRRGHGRGVLAFGVGWTAFIAVFVVAALATQGKGSLFYLVPFAAVGLIAMWFGIDAVTVKHLVSLHADKWRYERRSWMRKQTREEPLHDLRRVHIEPTGSTVGNKALEHVVLETRTNPLSLGSAMSQYEREWTVEWLEAAQRRLSGNTGRATAQRVNRGQSTHEQHRQEAAVVVATERHA